MPEPDYILRYRISAGTRNFTSGKSYVCVLARPAAAGTRGFKWFYSLSSRNTFVGGTCAPPSALLVSVVSMCVLTLLTYFCVGSFGQEMISCQSSMLYDPVTQRCEDCASVCSGHNRKRNEHICRQCDGKFHKNSYRVSCKIVFARSPVHNDICIFRLGYYRRTSGCGFEIMKLRMQLNIDISA